MMSRKDKKKKPIELCAHAKVKISRREAKADVEKLRRLIIAESLPCTKLSSHSQQRVGQNIRYEPGVHAVNRASTRHTTSNHSYSGHTNAWTDTLKPILTHTLKDPKQMQGRKPTFVRDVRGCIVGCQHMLVSDDVGDYGDNHGIYDNRISGAELACDSVVPLKRIVTESYGAPRYAPALCRYELTSDTSVTNDPHIGALGALGASPTPNAGQLVKESGSISELMTHDEHRD